MSYINYQYKSLQLILISLLAHLKCPSFSKCNYARTNLKSIIFLIQKNSNLRYLPTLNTHFSRCYSKDVFTHTAFFLDYSFFLKIINQKLIIRCRKFQVAFLLIWLLCFKRRFRRTRNINLFCKSYSHIILCSPTKIVKQIQFQTK